MYVKWFDTGMFYCMILVNLVNVTFCNFQISCLSVPYILTSQGTEPRRQMPEDIARDTARGTSRERRTR
ncbi:unnamed protein product [Staurois parvus]|uniref:Uncharacterized protein n=1 Tax=Staurois parvus TaxID=386267 RepID=A0ABN9HA50_9NEOB|nr:unnamed protein product [Staurois parvus]